MSRHARTRTSPPHCVYSSTLVSTFRCVILKLGREEFKLAFLKTKIKLTMKCIHRSKPDPVELIVDLPIIRMGFSDDVQFKFTYILPIVVL